MRRFLLQIHIFHLASILLVIIIHILRLLGILMLLAMHMGSLQAKAAVPKQSIVLLVGLIPPIVPSLSQNLQLETYSLGFREMPSNNNIIQPTLRAVYFSTNFCNKFTSIYYKIATNSSTNLACAQSEPNNNQNNNGRVYPVKGV